MRGRTTFCLLAILIAVAAHVTGQTAASPLIPRATSDLAPRLPEANLPELPGRRLPPRFPLPPWGGLGFTRAAGMIFSGTVKKVERRPATRGQEVETVAITFHVETAIRGATPGDDVVISQWMGLWSSGQRYRVGERVLLVLYPPSKLGLTSSVGGPLGRFAIDPVGRVLLTAQHLAAFQKDPVLGGKSRVRVSDFALAVRRAGEEE